MSTYHTIYDHYREKHVQLPKVILYNPIYKKLSSDAKIGWAILRDRSELSLKNNWVEKETGRIYFIFTVNELAEVLDLSRPTAIKVKKELVDAGLLIAERQGRNKPDKLYLMRPAVTEQDIYWIDEKDNYNYIPPAPEEEEKTETEEGNNEEFSEEFNDDLGSKNSLLPGQSLEQSGSQNFGLPEFLPPEVKNFYPNDTEYIYTDSLSLKPKTDDDENIYTHARAREVDSNLLLRFYENIDYELLSRFVQEQMNFNLFDVQQMLLYMERWFPDWIGFDLEDARKAQAAMIHCKANAAHFFATCVVSACKIRNAQYLGLSQAEVKKVPFYNWLEERE